MWAALLAIMLQLVLQASLHPGEHPRAALLRLTGVDIAPTGMMMPMAQMQETPTTHCADPPSTGTDHQNPTCPLCPLLEHVIFGLGALPLGLAVYALIAWRWFLPATPRAPPLQGLRDRPPSHAPPLFA